MAELGRHNSFFYSLCLADEKAFKAGKFAFWAGLLARRSAKGTF
jgi:hypothetical protein